MKEERFEKVVEWEKFNKLNSFAVIVLFTIVLVLILDFYYHILSIFFYSVYIVTLFIFSILGAYDNKLPKRKVYWRKVK